MRLILRYGLFVLGGILVCQTLKGQNWQPAGDRIKTVWTDKVDPGHAWQEYPRPQLVRKNWQNLNGLWDYAILAKGEKDMGTSQGKILVPYAVESSLSGVGKSLNEKQELWYQRTFSIPDEWKDRHVLLHFGAVDWQMTLWINGRKAGEHTGGSDPFTFDITRFLKKGEQQLRVRVWDPTDTDIQPRGKQTLDPRGFWYTAVSGIWQTVWLEPVAATYIGSFTPVADIDADKVMLHTSLINPGKHDQLALRVTRNGEVVHEETYPFRPVMDISVPDPQLWSPEFPNLYQVDLQIIRNGKPVDQVNSYFAMRKISVGQDERGFNRLLLNNEPLFQFGTLDQGWWPDGLLTPPNDQAMRYDMDVVKSLGFNMIRKHIKVEPDRYYYYADSIGLLLWQDMPSGFLDIQDPVQHVAHDAPEDWDRPAESARDFETEWRNIMDSKRFFPSIVVWVPFNEGWGQFDTKRIAEWTMEYDSTRLVNAASGWTDRKVGNFYDAHQYPGPAMEPPAENPDRVVVLGEFGGLGHPVDGHLWDPGRKNWGYRTYPDQDTLLNEYARLIHNVYPELARGLSAAIYTQTSDVEAEVNGLMTYDRKVLKFPPELMRVLHEPLFSPDPGKAEFVVPDAEIQPGSILVAFTNPGATWTSGEGPFEKRTGPVDITEGQSVWSVRTFTLDKETSHMAMKLFAHGNVRVYLNGQLVDRKFYRTKRHYDDVNLSDYSRYLKKGKNVLAVVVEKTPEDSRFDYGLYIF